MMVLVVIVLLSGCSNSFSADEGYRMSLINYSFPVPKNAGELKPEACTDEITKSSKYKLRNIGGENDDGPQPHYINEIKEWGWTELEDESTEMIRYFGKDDKMVCVVFNKHVIDVFEITRPKNP